MSEQPQISVPIPATLAATQRQRNTLADENAMLWAHVEQLTAELEQVRAAQAQLPADSQASGSSGR